MVCVSEVSICKVPEFVNAMNELGVKIVNQDLFNGTDCLSELCLESAYEDLMAHLIPVITKISFMVLLWLILHLFYSLIPGDI
jgi:hypothetical protein